MRINMIQCESRMVKMPCVAVFCAALLSMAASVANAQCTCPWTLTGSNITTNPAAANVGVGTSNPLTLFSVSANATTLPAPSANTLVTFGSSDTNFNRIEFLTFGGLPGNFSFRQARGTAANPTQTLANDSIGAITGFGYGLTGYSSGGRAQIVYSAAENWTDTANGTFMTFKTTPLGGTTLTEFMRIDGTGRVGIGTSSPAATLDVGGTANVSGNASVGGNLTVTGNIAAKYQDVAEWVPSTQALPAGTVVVLDQTHSNRVTASSQPYDTTVAGVVSANPGVILGTGGKDLVPVATTGRVRVRVDASRAPIHVGDLLVTGNLPGTAMKSEPIDLGGAKLHRPGTLIGKALEPLESGSGEILVLLSLQ